MNPWDKPKRTLPYDGSVIECEIGDRVIRSANWRGRGNIRNLSPVFECSYCCVTQTEWDRELCGVLQNKKEEVVARFCGNCFGDIISLVVLEKYRLQFSN